MVQRACQFGPSSTTMGLMLLLAIACFCSVSVSTAPTTATGTCDCSKCHEFSDGSDNMCCRFDGVSATILAFEASPGLPEVLDNYKQCTGATVSILYNDGTGEGDGEDMMQSDLEQDLGVEYLVEGDVSVSTEGAGVYDAYVVQGPWIPTIEGRLANIAPKIAQTTPQTLVDKQQFLSSIKNVVQEFESG
eukprot:UC1_evm4s313